MAQTTCLIVNVSPVSGPIDFKILFKSMVATANILAVKVGRSIDHAHVPYFVLATSALLKV
jgi:hypothetical protein